MNRNPQLEEIAGRIREDAANRMAAGDMPEYDEDGVQYTLEELERAAGVRFSPEKFIEMIFQIRSVNITYLHPERKDLFVVRL